MSCYLNDGGAGKRVPVITNVKRETRTQLVHHVSRFTFHGSMDYFKPPLELLGDTLALQKQQQIIAATDLRVGAGHVEAAERVRADHRAGDLAVQVEVADVELGAGALKPL